MPKKDLRVELLAVTPNAQSLIYAAFRQCYSVGFVGDLWPKLLAGEVSQDEQAKFIDNVLQSGHESPIEHVSVSFALEGVSRALTHQLVRHRIASYSQQSQRYVDESDFDYILPSSIAKSPRALEKFEETMAYIAQSYGELKEILKEDGHEGSKVREDARFVLPQACESKIVVTMNVRTLLNFFELRCCMRAQWEIRRAAKLMLKLCRENVPVIFDSAGAKCEKLGYCPEGERFTCGKYPLKDQ